MVANGVNSNGARHENMTIPLTKSRMCRKLSTLKGFCECRKSNVALSRLAGELARRFFGRNYRTSAASKLAS